MPCADLTIDFPFERGDDTRKYYKYRVTFWESATTIEWFRSRGYTLYKRRYNDPDSLFSTIPKLPLPESGDGDYPYGIYDANEIPDPFSSPLHAPDTEAKVAFAQDSQGRHVAIKIVRDDTDEHRILEFLRQQPVEILKENCVIPVLEILPIDGFCFAVMPRWGTKINRPMFRTMREVLRMMHAMLKGLNFLHQHNIVHGDISMKNFLTDDFGDFMVSENPFREYRRAAGLALYAIYDFDFSLKLPADVNRSDYWISNEHAWGTFNVTMDFAQGEYDYNPFITDVGTLGEMFSHKVQYLIPALPILAPFLDKLTTHRLNERFTASEALSFFEEFHCQLTEEELSRIVWEKGWDNIIYDRWAAVPPEFAEKWAHYREPPVSWTTEFLRKACRYRFLRRNVTRVRRCLAWISNCGRAIASYFTTGQKISLT